jgi:protein-S-isoprenylcysteine O-methyltransferase Ste14
MKQILNNLVSLILPITALIIVPYLLEPHPVIQWKWYFFTGAFICFTGLLIMILSIRLFIVIGNGTLAPWNPPKKFVVTGLYMYVRNPMIIGVLIVLTGEALLFYSFLLLLWCALFYTVNHFYFILFEEPQLLKRFGDDYQNYKMNVPRWIPRIKPWNPL